MADNPKTFLPTPSVQVGPPTGMHADVLGYRDNGRRVSPRTFKVDPFLGRVGRTIVPGNGFSLSMRNVR
jgi:hypothetical protein